MNQRNEQRKIIANERIATIQNERSNERKCEKSKGGGEEKTNKKLDLSENVKTKTANNKTKVIFLRRLSEYTTTSQGKST